MTGVACSGKNVVLVTDGTNPHLEELPDVDRTKGNSSVIPRWRGVIF